MPQFAAPVSHAGCLQGQTRALRGRGLSDLSFQAGVDQNLTFWADLSEKETPSLRLGVTYSAIRCSSASRRRTSSRASNAALALPQLADSIKGCICHRNGLSCHQS